MAAKVKELSTSEKLKQLYELQLVDSELDQIGTLKGELPVEVNDLEDEIAGMETRMQRSEAQLKEHETEISKQKGNIKTGN